MSVYKLANLIRARFPMIYITTFEEDRVTKYIKSVVTDENGKVVEIHCDADLETGTGGPTDRKVKGTIHWLSADKSARADVILYNRLFTEENMNDLPEGKVFKDFLNPESAIVIKDAVVENSLLEAKPGESFQFVRQGYFAKDTKNSNTFNLSVSLKDSFKA